MLTYTINYKIHSNVYDMSYEDCHCNLLDTFVRSRHINL
jgi:hypothetical protein